MKIKVENTYEDGYESTVEYEIDDATVPSDDDELQELFWEYTGDGHGIGHDLGMISEITILDGERAGETYEIGG